MTGRRDYAERRASRIERLRARAQGKRVEAHQRLTKNDALLGVMNGTPVLRGHHSEKRHRRDLARIDNDMRKGFEAAKEAEQLDRRADFAEANTAISSDDPEALVKLRAKVAALEADRERAKAINKIIRKHRGKGTEPAVAALITFGISASLAAQLVQPDAMGNIGVPTYMLTNQGAEIRRVQARIAQIEASVARAAQPDVEIGDVRICEADNRVQIHFPGKPCEELRARLKTNGFRWAPSVGAWQRVSSAAAWELAKRLAASTYASS